MADLLELLMRTYTGIFNYVQPIDEEYLSRRLSTTVPQLRQLLYRLALEHVINYVPADHSDVVFLRHGRLEPGNIDLKPKLYRMLKDNCHTRSQSMIEYVSEETECRSRFLLRYFGQEDTEDCGTCDVCRARKARECDREGLREKTRMALIEYADLSGGHYSVQDVVARFSNPAAGFSPDYLDILRELIDKGIVPPCGD